MRDLGYKMAELKFEAPLAKFDDTDEWGSCDFLADKNIYKDTINCREAAIKNDSKLRLLEEAVYDAHVSKNGVITGELNCESNFTETFGGSLNDLVHTFDEKITKCFGNYEQNVEELAPVQVRSQDEIMNECQMWWTITGNYGNILPIDWSKSYTRQMHALQKQKNGKILDVQTPNSIDDNSNITSEDEAILNNELDNALNDNSNNTETDLQIESYEEVIKEIDNIMDEAQSPISEPEKCETEAVEKAKEVLCTPLYADKLHYLNATQLNDLYMEMEALISELSETLINELALRDELEYEKELKNSTISLLLTVQNKRRQYHVEKKRGKMQGPQPKYLTTVIPYNLDNGMPNNETLQTIIKILKAINEDSPTVPTLLTDYILKVLCPT